MDPICPACHTTVRATDYFCFNCGKNLHEKPLPTNIYSEILYYVGSVLLPPIGFWWGLKYLKQNDPVSKRIGIVSMIITVVMTLFVVRWTMQIAEGINAQVNQQLDSLQGF